MESDANPDQTWSIRQVASRPLPGTSHASMTIFSPSQASLEKNNGASTHRNGTLLAFLDPVPNDLPPGSAETRDVFMLDCETLETHRMLMNFGEPSTNPGLAGDVSDENLPLEVKMMRERMRNLSLGVSSFSWNKEGTKLLIPHRGEWAEMDVKTGSSKIVIGKHNVSGGAALDVSYSAVPRRFAFVSDGDVYVMPSDEQPPVCVSYPVSNGTPGLSNGLASYLAQEEMGRHEGYWWSSCGSYIAYERVDERHVPTFSIPHLGANQTGPSTQEVLRYPFVGCRNPRIELRVARVDDTALSGNACKDSILLDLERFAGNDFYMARVDWWPGDQGYLCVQLQNREQSVLKLVRFHVETGAGTVLLQEHSPVWINLHNLFYPLPHRTGSLQSFLWGSERNGFMHLYLYCIEENGVAKCVRRVTSSLELGDELVVEDILRYDPENQLVYMYVNIMSVPLERHVLVASVSGTDTETRMLRITPLGGTYTCVMDEQLRYAVMGKSSVSEPLQLNLCALAEGSGMKTRLISYDLRKNGDANLKRLKTQVDESSFSAFTSLCSVGKGPGGAPANLVPPVVLQIHAPSDTTGDTLYAHVHRPDPKKFGDGPFPTIVAVYGGPHVQRVRNDWTSTCDLRTQRMIQRGFVVMKLDNRGTSRRGLKFESSIRHRMGSVELDDQALGVAELVKIGLCDPKRVGIVGWSYGGYLSGLALMKRPDVFHVAVAGGPVTSWDGYDTHYTERYMGTPENNPAGYKDSSLLEHCDKLVGKLLLIHGLIDENVHFRHTARLIESLIKANKEYDLVLFPSERHSPRGLAARCYLEERVAAYFEKHFGMSA